MSDLLNMYDVLFFEYITIYLVSIESILFDFFIFLFNIIVFAITISDFIEVIVH